MEIIELITNEQQIGKEIYFIYGDEEISENILSDLLDTIRNDELKFIPESLIKDYGDDDKSSHQDFPLYNIKDSKYLVITGVTQYNFDLGFIKSLTGGDGYFCNFSKRIIYTQAPKLIIFCDNDPTDYLVELGEQQETAFLKRTKVVENGILL